MWAMIAGIVFALAFESVAVGVGAGLLVGVFEVFGFSDGESKK